MNIIKSKTCFKCGSLKPLFDFHKHPSMKDGTVNKCKECNNRDVRENRIKRLDQYRDYDKVRNARADRVAARTEYAQTEAGKVSHLKANKKYRETYPKADKARSSCANAIKRGELLKVANCETCGNPSREAHHDDYNYPLQVRWLCITCHKKWHKHNTPKNRR